MPTRVGNLPSVDTVNDNQEWNKELALKIFYKYVYPTQVDAESKAIRDNLLTWLFDADDWSESQELKGRFDEAEFDRINKEALGQIENSTLEDIWKNPEKFGVTSTETQTDFKTGEEVKRKIWGEDFKNIEADILSSPDKFKQILTLDKKLKKVQESIRNHKRQITDAQEKQKNVDKRTKPYKMLDADIKASEDKIKSEEKSIKYLQRKIKSLKDDQFDDSITLKQVLTDEDKAQRFYSLYDTDPDIDSEAAFALAVSTNVEEMRYDASEEGKAQFEKDFGIPYEVYAHEKKEYDEKLKELQENLAKYKESLGVGDKDMERPEEVSSKTMGLAYTNRDKTKFPKEQDYTKFLQNLDDDEWVKHFKEVIKNSPEMRALAAHIQSGKEYVEVTDEDEGITQLVSREKFIKPATYEKMIPARPRKTKDTGREEFLSIDRKMDKDTILKLLTEIEDRKRAKAGNANANLFGVKFAKVKKEKANEVKLRGEVQLDFMEQYARTIGAKSKEAIRTTRRDGKGGTHDPIEGVIVLSELKRLPEELLNQLPGLEAQAIYDNITKAIEMYLSRKKKTVEESLASRLNKILAPGSDGGKNHFEWLSFSIKLAEALHKLDQQPDINLKDYIEGMKKYDDSDKQYWDKRKTQQSLFSNIKKLADGGPGEADLFANIRTLNLIGNDTKVFLETYIDEKLNVEDLVEEEEDEDKITAQLKGMSLSDLKRTARELFPKDEKENIKGMDKDELIYELTGIMQRMEQEEAGGGLGEDEETEVAGDDGKGLLVGAEGELEQFEEDEEQEDEEDEDKREEIFDYIIDVMRDILEEEDEDTIITQMERMMKENLVVVEHMQKFINWKSYRLTSTNMKKSFNRFIKLVGEDKFEEMLYRHKDEDGNPTGEPMDFIKGPNAQENRENIFNETDGPVKDSIKNPLRVILANINRTWSQYKDELSKVSQNAFDDFLENINFNEMLADKIHASRLNNIRWGDITMKTKGITIKMNFSNGTYTIDGKIEYKVLQEYRPVTQLEGDVPRWQFSPHYMKDSQWQKFRKFGGKRIAPSGGIVAEGGKKGQVDADRYKFLTTLITNFNRLNQVVRV
tara:strand:- start:1347 stop:4604 length:3258 start_codon:yes stop_codon:yes gene_type:complete